MDDEQQGRVLRYAAERFGVAQAQDPRRGRAIEANVDLVDEDFTDDEVTEEAPDYEHFAELFGAAGSPEKNEDKALVAAYWVQVIQGHDQWASRLLNNELRNLGRPISNITEALSSNMKKKPQRVMQLRKTGTTKQGNKTYKITHEGLVYVQGLLGHGAD